MNKNKFTGKAEAYQKARPGYPDAGIDYIMSFLPPNPVLADIGSGTGKMTELLLKYAAKVYAVEPNRDMRAVADARLNQTSGYQSIGAAAESTTLDDACVDAITVAQALHWFDIERFRAECKRILKPQGMVFVIYNRFFGEIANSYERFLRPLCPQFDGFASGNLGQEKLREFFCGQYSEQKFYSKFVYSQPTFVNRALSSSYTPKSTDDGFKEFVNKLELFFHAHKTSGTEGDVIVFQNETIVYMQA